MSTSTVPTVGTGTTLGEVARRMRAAGADAVAVIDDAGAPVGVITERELVDAVAASRHPDQGTAGSWMRTDVVAVAAGDAAAITRLPDTDAGGLVVPAPPVRRARARR